jgi:uncharacterized protein YhhL (DUF1145 family)
MVLFVDVLYSVKKLIFLLFWSVLINQIFCSLSNDFSASVMIIVIFVIYSVGVLYYIH